MSTMKKVLSVLLALVMVLSLVACGGSTETPADTKAPENKPASTDATKAEAPAEKTTITFINGFTGGDGPFMTKNVDGFYASQDLYYIEQLQDSDHYTKFKSDDFDMLIIHADWISTYHAMGLLREVSDIYEMAGLNLETDWHPITKTYAVYDDGVFAFPLDLYAETFFYNKAYVTGEQPHTYEDMIALRDQLDSTNSNIYPMSIPLTGDHQWAWMTALGQSGVNWVEGEHIKLDTEEACDAFMKIHDLIYVDHISASGLGDTDHFNTFVKEADGNSVTAAVALMGPWNYTAAKAVLGDDQGIGTLPQLYGDTPCVPAGGHTFGVSAKCTDENKIKGIAEFMKYAFQADVMLNWADAGQAPIFLAAMEAVKQDPEKYPVANVNYGVFDNAMILPAIYNIREQVKYVNTNVWSMVVQTENLDRDALMAELQIATEIATELSEY